MATVPYNFRLNEETDKVLIKLLDESGNRSELIKNALFHYFLHIAKGELIDRELPLGWGVEFSDLLRGCKPKDTVDDEDDDTDDSDEDCDDSDIADSDADDDDSDIDDNAEFEIEF